MNSVNQKIRILDPYVEIFGLVFDSVYDTVELPAEYLHMVNNRHWKRCVWVYSHVCKGPVRLLPHEYCFVV